MLYRLSRQYGKSKGFVCGVVTEGGKVIRAADMFSWAVGKRIDTVLAWCKSKYIKVEIFQ